MITQHQWLFDMIMEGYYSLTFLFILKNVFGQGILHVKNQTKGSNYFPPLKIFELGLFLQEQVRVIINGTETFWWL